MKSSFSLETMKDHSTSDPSPLPPPTSLVSAYSVRSTFHYNHDACKDMSTVFITTVTYTMNSLGMCGQLLYDFARSPNNCLVKKRCLCRHFEYIQLWLDQTSCVNADTVLVCDHHHHYRCFSCMCFACHLSVTFSRV